MGIGISLSSLSIGGANLLGPASLGGLGIWISPETIVHDGTNVISWANIGTLGGSFTNTIDTSRRFRVDLTGNPIGGPCARVNAANNSYMVADSSMLSILNAKVGGTVFIVWKTSGTQTQTGIVITGTTNSQTRMTAQRQGDGNGNGSVCIRYPGNNIDGTFENVTGSAGLFTDDVWDVDTYVMSVPKQHCTTYWNGVVGADEWIWYGSPGATTTATNSARVIIGSGGDTFQYDPMRNRVAELLVFDRDLAYNELVVVWDYLHAKYGITKRYTSIDYGIVYDGDSIEQSLTKAQNKLPLQVTRLLPNPNNKWFRNDAITGSLIQTIASDINATRGYGSITLPVGLTKASVLHMVSMGTNNVASGSESASSAYSRVVSYFNTKNSAGWTGDTALMAQIPRTDVTTTTRVFDFNQQLYDNFDVLTDLGMSNFVYPMQSTVFDDGNDPVNQYPTYYQSDSNSYIHPTGPGNDILRPFQVAQLKSMIKRLEIIRDYGSEIKGWWRNSRRITRTGTAITNWGNDAATGSNYDLAETTATSTRRPTFTANSRRGYAGVTLSGSADPNNSILQMNSAGKNIINGAGKVLIVFTYTFAAAPAANGVIFGATINGSSSTGRLFIQHTTTDKIVIAARAGDVGSAVSLTGATSMASGTHVIACLFDFTNYVGKIWVDGTLDGTNNSFDNSAGTWHTFANTSAGYFGIGSNGNNTSQVAGVLLEGVLATDPASPDNLRDALEDYMGNKFGVTVT